MRIVAGKYRRRKLEANPGKTTRPITDLAKEILFERLQNDLIGKRVADIFSGTGSLGLEAISRGATGAVFMENDRSAFQLLKKNVETIIENEPTLCWRCDALKSSFRPQGVPELTPFDTIFFDPPYRMIADLQPGQPIYRSIERLARDEISSEQAVLVLRTPRDSQFDFPPHWNRDRIIPLRSMEAHIFDKTQ